MHILDFTIDAFSSLFSIYLSKANNYHSMKNVTQQVKQNLPYLFRITLLANFPPVIGSNFLLQKHITN